MDNQTITWLDPWVPAKSEKVKVGFKMELARELQEGHPLHGSKVSAIGCRGDNDDVLFEIQDGVGRYAVVHLSWSSKPETPPWPHTTYFETLEAWIEKCMKADHDAI